MNIQRYLMASVAVFVVFGIVFVGAATTVFADQFAAIAQSFGMSDEPTWVSWLGRVLLTLVFCYIFIQGREGKGLAEGARYGLLIGLLMLGVDLDWYGYKDIGLTNGIAGWVTGIVAYVAGGVTVAAIYKPEEAAPAAA